MWFIGVEVEQETSAPPPKKNPGSAPVLNYFSLYLKVKREIPLNQQETQRCVPQAANKRVKVQIAAKKKESMVNLKKADPMTGTN